MGDLAPIMAAIGTAIDTAAGITPIYFTNIPQDATPPYVRWEVVNSQEDPEMRVYTDPDHGEETWINIHVWDTDMASAVAIHDTIKAALSNTVITPTGWKSTRKPRRETSAPLPDVESGLFRMWSRWSLRFCRP